MKHLYKLFILSIFCGLTTNAAFAQTHTFSTFSPGTLTSGTSGISTSLSTGGVTGNYLVYIIEADFVGTGNVAWSNSIQTELSNGAGTIYKDLSLANTGSAGNPNATTLIWTGIMNAEYVGGGNLTIRFFDDFHDGGGPYTSDISNVTVTIHEMTSNHAFSTFSPGTLTSGTSGVSTSLNTTGLTESYLLYKIEADFVGTGNVAWSNSIQTELNNGAGVIYKDLSLANTGAAGNPNATTLIWTGIMNSEYVGGGDLTLRFYDNFHDGSGPYTSDITNVQVSIYEMASEHSFATYSPGTLTSGTSGISTAMNVTGIPTDDHFVYKIEADFVGTGNVAWSNSIQTELNNGAGIIYKDLSFANIGAAGNPNATTLIWTGIMNSEYVGGGDLTLRFFDDFHDGSGPYTSSITNVNFTIYSNVDAILPVELLYFQATITDDRVVQLDWATASETNNDYFAIERSTDGENFREIARVNGKGFSSERTSYTTVDPAPLSGLNYYRLKQIDLDGTYTYSPIEAIRMTTPVDISCYPNPSSSIFNISIQEQTAGSNETVTVYDALGKALLNISLGETNNQIDLSGFPVGLYTAKFHLAGETIRLNKTP